MGGKMVYNLRFVGWDLDLRTRLTIHRFSQDKPDIDGVYGWLIQTDSNIERS